MNKVYKDHHVFNDPVSQYETKISIVDCDTLGAAKEGSCCLNFASHKRPGGGYLAVMDIPIPIRTQEEDLFRRSNLPSLMDTPALRRVYPLMGLKGIYTPNIFVFKDQKLGPLDNPFNISLVTVPAVVNPGPDDADLVRDKVRRILDIAADNNQTELILGAWGCGVFNNEPETIAKLFMGFLKNEFKGVFENVIFAIPNKKHPNYQLFEAVIEKEA
jgi:uncharacterized protein (TIGR02452 family)